MNRWTTLPIYIHRKHLFVQRRALEKSHGQRRYRTKICIPKQKPLSGARRSKKRRLLWIGHLFRLPEDAPATQAFAEGIRKVKRPRGKPKTTWLGAVQKELHELNLTLDNAKEIAQERQKWTDIVDGAISND